MNQDKLKHELYWKIRDLGMDPEQGYEKGRE